MKNNTKEKSTMQNKRSRTVKQITLHFAGDTEYIIDAARKMARIDMRTPEQELLYILSKVFKAPKNAKPIAEPAAEEPPKCEPCADEPAGTTTEPKED